MPDEYKPAVNRREIANLRERARRTRQTAWYVTDKETSKGLVREAQELEDRAAALEAALPDVATLPPDEGSTDKPESN